jgi:hypothetical protein
MESLEAKTAARFAMYEFMVICAKKKSGEVT